jgi:hypothetical protein
MRISIVIDNFNILEGMPKLHENNPKNTLDVIWTF